jgi:hypothetical protein
MSHHSIELAPSKLLLSARLVIVLSLSLALWLGLGWGLVAASRLPATGAGGVTGGAEGEVAYDFALQGTCDITVTAAADSGPGSLRQAIADACDGGRITFAGNYTIYLNSTLEITRRVTVDGETHAVTVSGDSGGDGTPNVRVFSIGSSGVVTLAHLNIVSGTVSDGSYDCPGDCGGGIYNGGRLTVQNSTLSGNSAYHGGAIDNLGALTVQNSVLSGNSATWGGGGSIYNFGTLTVQTSTLSVNVAYSSGGGIYNGGTLTVQTSTLSGNRAREDYGGGIYNGGTVVVTNSTLSTNSAWDGGGIYNEGTLTVRSSTLAGNSAAYDSGGIRNNEGILSLYNTLIANSPGGDCINSGDIVTGDHSLTTNTGYYACNLTDGANGNIIGVDPLLGPLADNGGGTQTHALLPGSPAMDAGATCPAADQRGIVRPQGVACDIGAFEWQSALGMAVLGNGQVVPDGDAAPSVTDGTDFGGVALGQALTRTFTISNSGALDLTLTGSPVISIGGPAAFDFSLVALPATTLAPQTTTTFQVRFTPSVSSRRVATVTIANNDPPKNPYDFAIWGTVCDMPVTNDHDSGPGSLRQAIAEVCDGGRITFADDYTIYLNSTLSVNKKRLTIDGEAHAVTISGDVDSNPGTPNVQVFSIGISGVATLAHLNIIGGLATAPWGCSTGGCGGGISSFGTLIVQSSTLSGNSAYFGGGAIANGGTLTVTNSTLFGNSAAWGGGGGIYNFGTLTIQNSTFSGNSNSNDSGGAIFNMSMLTVTNSTFSGNSAYNGGGGIYNYQGTLTVQNSTLSGNSAEWSGGGGIHNEGTLRLYNTLIAYSPDGGDCTNNGGSIPARDHNLMSNTGYYACNLTDGTNGNIIGIDPLLGPLDGYGGSTPTYALLPGSPAIGAGNNATCLATDQRGVARPQGVACDIGAFESRGFSLALIGGNNQSAPINAPFAQPLSVAVSSTAGEPVGPGGVIAFTAPGAGASLAPPVLTAMTDAGGAAGVIATANSLVGSYAVTATAAGASTPVTFNLTNLSAPAMVILGNGQVIADGDGFPSFANGTGFYSLAVDRAVTHTFTISNGGTLDLTLTGSTAVSIDGPAALDFSLVVSPALMVAPGATTTFQVRFTPSITGTRVATATIANNDPVKNPYDFAIWGAASNAPPIFLPVILRGAQ